MRIRFAEVCIIALSCTGLQPPTFGACDHLSSTDSYLTQLLQRRHTMSVPRLTFLYPHIYKSIRSCEPTVTQPLRELRRPSSKQLARFHESARSRQETIAQRYGTATEPQPLPPLPFSVGGGPALETQPERGATGQAKQEGQKTEAAAKKDVQKPNQDGKEELKTTKPATPSTDTIRRPAELDAAESHPEQPREPVKEGVTKPLETFLTMESAEEKAEDHKPPHLQAPLYVHHFDTYTLVRDLEKGGFTEDQSVTVMKAVRSLLALNLDIAREGLESKSDIENVCYCSLESLNDTCIERHDRKPTSSEPPAQNCAPKSPTRANYRWRRCAPSALNCSMKWTS